MSDQSETQHPPIEQHEPIVAAPEPTTPVAEDESTIGTGTSMALGCIAGTMLLILFGLAFLALNAIF